MLRLAKWIPAGRDFDSWLNTLHQQLRAEIDYPRELAVARQMAAGLTALPDLNDNDVEVCVPTFFDAFSGAGCLTMDYVAGFRAGSTEVAGLPQERRNALGRLMLRLFFVEVFDLGIMQTDPNFGNYLISAEGDRLTLLDFGSVVVLDEPLRRALCDTIVAGCQGEEQALFDALERLGCLPADAGSHARDTFRTFICNLLEPWGIPTHCPGIFKQRRGVLLGPLRTDQSHRTAGGSGCREQGVFHTQWRLCDGGPQADRRIYLYFGTRC